MAMPYPISENSSNKKYKKHKYGLDYAIVILTAACLIFLMYFTEIKLSEVIASDREALLMEHDPNDPIHMELAEEIMRYRPESYKMIEVYSEDYKPMFRVQFRDDAKIPDGSITDHQGLINLFMNNQDGHTEVTIDNEVEDIYFRWTYTTTGEKCLFIIYMSRPIVENLWIIRVICIFIMILVVFLLVRIRLHEYDQEISNLRRSSIDVQNAIFH